MQERGEGEIVSTACCGEPGFSNLLKYPHPPTAGGFAELMPDHFIAIEDARHDLLTAAAYVAERIRSGDGHAQAMSAIVPRYLAAGNVDLAAEFANTVDDPFTRDKLLTAVAEKCAELDDDEYAIQLAEAIEEFGLRSEAFERIALQKVHKGEIEKAIGIAETMMHPDLVFASAAARSCV